MQAGTTKDQGLYNKRWAAVHPGAVATETLPEYNTLSNIFNYFLFFLIHFDIFSVLALFYVRCVKGTMNIIQSVAVECDDMRKALVMTRIEYKEIKFRDIDNKIPYNK